MSYAILKFCYQHVSTRAPNPSRADMKKVAEDLRTLYQKEEPHPPGIPLATHVDNLRVNDATPLEDEVDTVFFRLHPFKAGGHAHIREEHFKQCMWETYPGDVSKTSTRTE